MLNFKNILLSFLFTLLIQYSAFAQEKDEKASKKIEKKLEQWKKDDLGIKHYQQIKIDSFKLAEEEKQLSIYFAPDLSYLPIREDDSKKLYASFADVLEKKYKEYKISIISNKLPIEDLIPNWARKEYPPDEKRKGMLPSTGIPLVRKPGKPVPTAGLYNNNLALWPSHGYYYESSLDRWEYQRARLFSTVEDLHPTRYMLQYLVPMLENAGAQVFLPRERDTQVNEVVVDNDVSGKSKFIIPNGLKYEIIKKGFLPKDTIFPQDKPFEMGTSLKLNAADNAGKSIQYVPEFPEKGSYAVYISYSFDNSNSTNVEYLVRHAGGETRFLVNQKIGGGTWIYLGTFIFDVGQKAEKASVAINIKGNENGRISADAVRFGGGMGNVARRPSDNSKVNYQWKLSGKPRYMEAARYNLHYSGMPDTLVYNLNKDKNDYTDDLQSRGEWINYLIGSSKLQYRNSFNLGLNIPVDLSLALHSDAGTTPNDSVIGTLCIYSTEKNNGVFPNGQSKITSRDFADMVQTQVVEDIQKQINPEWTRRAMWDRGYSEAYRQIVPAVLLELLSHQNLADMRLSLDPRFRFTASRAIYKGILKYLAFQNNRTYVVQPLPVDHFAISYLGDRAIQLTWKPVTDSLEPTAKPLQYKVYRRIGDRGFDNGVIVTDTFLRETFENYGEIYSYRVTALNEGGESFPSEILSVGFKENAPVVLVVNGFDRISAPAFIDNDDMAGIAWWEDEGVPYLSEIGFTGNQYNFDRKSEWMDDDSPGWGASKANMEGKIIPGNTFDFPYIHGEAILANGYSFVSVSDEVFTQKQFNAAAYSVIDIIMGEEKSIPSFKNKAAKDFQIYTPAFMGKITEVTAKGTNIFLSGAYIGTDLLNTGDSIAIKFAQDVLHFQWRTDHAVTDGMLYATDNATAFFKGNYSFNSTYNPQIYTVEAPDAIDPEGLNANTILRYRENNSSAGVAFKGRYNSVVCGFPFESIKSQQERKDFMLQVLNFLENK